MAVFIGGTDTDVGKTFVTALLAKCLVEKELDVGVQKWVTSGSEGLSADCRYIYQFIERDIPVSQARLVAPYNFPFPASPHLAAEHAGRTIDINVLKKALSAMASRYPALLVEGVGGLLVPLTRDLLLIDLVERWRLATILVARSGLGTLNHTLLSLEALKRRHIPVVGVVLNSEEGADPEIVKDNLRVLSQMGGVPVFGPIPRVDTPQDAMNSIRPLANVLVRHFSKKGLSEMLS